MSEEQRLLRERFGVRQYESLDEDEKREYDEIVAFYAKRRKEIPNIMTGESISSAKPAPTETKTGKKQSATTSRKGNPDIAPKKGRAETTQRSEERASTTIDFSDRNNGILLKIATPDIYCINAFRVLEMPVTASLREASQQMWKLGLMEKLGEPGQMDRGILPLTPVPDADARREAHQRLGDPESRLVDELFWFWPLTMGLPESEDEALAALKRKDLPDAVSIWKHRETNASEANVSMHNLAIMYHVLALDMERTQTLETFTKKQSQQKREYWEQAFSRWQVLLNHDGFWNRLTNRIRELDDPRLTRGTAHRIRGGLPFVLLSINAKLAVQAAQKGNKDEALYHVSLMSKSGFDNVVVEEALREAVAPIRTLIKTICANAENETQRAPEHADETARSVIDQTSQLLAALDIVLPKEHLALTVAHDDVASQILTSQIAFGKKTENWRASLVLLEQALQIAVGTSVRRRMQENVEAVKDNLEYGTCWFCKERPSEDKAAAEVKMYGEVTRTTTWEGTRLQWRHTSVKVPRCAICQSAHTRSGLSIGLGTVVGILIGLGGCIAAISADEDYWFVGLLTLGAGIAAGAGIGYAVSRRLSPKGIADEEIKNEYPTVKKLKSEGWEFGDKPPDAQ